jgi:hypothetical protein
MPKEETLGILDTFAVDGKVLSDIVKLRLDLPPEGIASSSRGIIRGI